MLTIIITKVQENKEQMTNNQQPKKNKKQCTILILEVGCQFDAYESPLLGKSF